MFLYKRNESVYKDPYKCPDNSNPYWQVENPIADRCKDDNYREYRTEDFQPVAAAQLVIRLIFYHEFIRTDVCFGPQAVGQNPSRILTNGATISNTGFGKIHPRKAKRTSAAPDHAANSCQGAGIGPTTILRTKPMMQPPIAPNTAPMRRSSCVMGAFHHVRQSESDDFRYLNMSFY